jgi:hypothetical protein
MMASLCRTTQHQQPVEHSSGAVLFAYVNVSTDNALVLTSGRAVSAAFVSVWTSPCTFARICCKRALVAMASVISRARTCAVLSFYGTNFMETKGDCSGCHHVRRNRACQSNEEGTNQVRQKKRCDGLRKSI